LFQEVEVPGGIVDIVAVYGRARTAIEVKNSCSMAVIGQAHKNLSYFHYSYIAIPTTPNCFQKMICSNYGIGILRYDGMIHEDVKPDFRRRVIDIKLHDYQKLSVAGSQNQRETAFSNSVRQIKQTLARGPMPLKELFTKAQKYHWASLYSARNCFVDLVGRGIIKGVQIENGIAKLIPEAKP
jgi:hypothetical protein